MILKDRFELDLCNRWDEIKGSHLLGYDMAMTPRHMVYFFFEIEKAFEITIPEEYIVNGELKSLENIARIISVLLESRDTRKTAGDLNFSVC
jgi:peptide maturation system acyl carrier-related protein